jgi:hypothetical protein
MLDAERAKLVERIVGTWPAGPRGFVWTSTLAELDADLATAAYERLVVECVDHPPTPGRFLSTYWAVANPREYGFARPEDTGPVISPAEALELDDLEPLRRLKRGEFGASRTRHPSSRPAS